MPTVILCSGGLDSVVLAHKLVADRPVCLLSFNYGQRHNRELNFAGACAERIGAEHISLDLTSVGQHLSGSALTDQIDVPDGHYAESSMKLTVVPNRNAIMLTIAYGIALAKGANQVATAVHGGDHFIYPDCRPAFIQSFETMQNLAIDGMGDVSLLAPFLTKTKADIVGEGASLGVAFELSWSCYKGGARHCGRCGTCVERREAFALAGVADPTEYDDQNFWLEAIKTGAA